jgi:hypothetical protein
MTIRPIDRMRMIVGVDDRFAEVQAALSGLADSFEASVTDSATELSVEEILSGLTEIMDTTTRLMLLITPPPPPKSAKKQEGNGSTGVRKRGRTWPVNGEELTFNEIAARAPDISPNTLRFRLDRVGREGRGGWTMHEVFHGKSHGTDAASAPAPPA